MTTQINKSDLVKNKRVLSFDFGMVRIGWAVCDELHITVTPKGVLLSNDDNLWTKIQQIIVAERIGAVVVGVPYRNDGSESVVIMKIKEFMSELKEKTGLDVFDFDESFSSVEASSTMVSIGKKKKKRAEKGSKDMVAAALILRNFLNEL